MHHPRCVLRKLGGGGIHQNTTVFVSYLLGWRHVSATVGHPQVSKMYNEEKIYVVWSLVEVHILNFQLDVVVLRLSVLKLIIYSTGKVDREQSINRIYSRNSRTFLTKILYLNLGCVIYATKRFYVNKSGYTGNFFLNIILKAWITRWRELRE